VESEEVNYFLVLAPFQAWLVDHIRTHDDFIQPGFFRGEILAMLEEPLDDLSLSRPRSRVSLGVELPFDADYVTYVWFDALINYISSLGWPDDAARMDTWWPAVSHLMAKDIIKTHCIYWPIMLRALGIPPARHCLVHGYWVGEGGRKMSKSLGNAVDPMELMDLTGADGLRFYLLKNMTSVDSTVSTRLVVETYNADLANTVGNLYSRVLKFADGGRIPDPAELDPADTAVLDGCVALAADAFAQVEFETLSLLPKTILEIAARLNAHVAAVAPWKLAKEEGGGGDRLASVIYTMLEGLRVLAELAWPVMPAASERALERLGRAPSFSGAEAHRFVPYALPRGGAIPVAADSLFPRVR
jgi:methionyl-tRNA synthetase